MISKGPENKENFLIKGLFTKNARTAWRLIIEVISQGIPKKILMPSYIGYTDREGSGVFDPVQNTGSNFLFYRVNSDLSIDLDDLRAKINAGVDILLIIHYFGFCRSDLSEIKKICNHSGVILVEDCAHAFYISQESSMIGNTGDFSFYSLHKYLPTSAGGLLKINNDRYKLPSVSDQDMADYSVISQYGLAEFSAIAKIRRRNYKVYWSVLNHVHGISPMYELLDNDIPQTFPLLVKNDLREKLYYYLMEKNMPTTALYYRLIDEISPSEFPNSYFVSKNILNLPVHQDVDESDAYQLCSSIRNFIETR